MENNTEHGEIDMPNDRSIRFTRTASPTFNFASLPSRLITKAQLEEAKKQLDYEKPNYSPVNADKYLDSSADKYDDREWCKDMCTEDCGSAPGLEYRNKFEVAQVCDDGFWSSFESVLGPKSSSAVCVTPNPVWYSESLSLLEVLEPHITRWIDAFNNSRCKPSITKLIQAKGKNTRRVHSVMGLGLGRPASWTWLMNHLGGDEAMDGKESSFFQHLIVFHIVDTFSRVQGSHVNVLVQDPRLQYFLESADNITLP
jgi:hypothetical protein